MLKAIKRWLIKRLGGIVNLIDMTEWKERQIMRDLKRVEFFSDYLNLQIGVGYQLFAKTRDEKYLGWSELAEHILSNMSKVEQKEESTPDNGGYNSIV